MSTTAQTRAAIAAVLTAGFPTYNVSAYADPSPDPPAMDMKSGETLYDTAMARGNDELSYVVRVMQNWGDAISAQKALDAMLDTDQPSSSFKGVLEADRTLGGTVSAVRVVSASEPQIMLGAAGVDTIFIEFTVAVTPNG